ncbi:hypothetical protein WICPIJ_005332, partial [Wickerhamomyces pijperi]
DLLDFLHISMDSLSESDENIKQLFEKTWIVPVTEYAGSLAKFQEMVETTIDLDSLDNASSAHSSMVAINPEFDASLMEINQK